jgi:crotonobetainyl-CoA:carnitine CoA-transferase CaiB-like acyl-CoA transferase
MFEHPQVLAEDMVAEIAHPVVGSYRGVTRPIAFGRTPGPVPFAAPTFDQDAEHVLGSGGKTRASG